MEKFEFGIKFAERKCELSASDYQTFSKVVVRTPIILRKDKTMLVLSRKAGQSIEIGEGITVTVTQIKGNKVRIGISAPAEVPIHRHELTIDDAKIGGLTLVNND